MALVLLLFAMCALSPSPCPPHKRSIQWLQSGPITPQLHQWPILFPFSPRACDGRRLEDMERWSHLKGEESFYVLFLCMKELILKAWMHGLITQQCSPLLWAHLLDHPRQRGCIHTPSIILRSIWCPNSYCRLCESVIEEKHLSTGSSSLISPAPEQTWKNL